ncbi:hypothetical protein ACFVRD_43065 [Streptomyces sp. NPDC057908]|uniref:hypothetical protein n=1 Tax=Streptomyces sp. NPDC057908 TaxID=3346276 RepID=UPI0036DFBAE9
MTQEDAVFVRATRVHPRRGTGAAAVVTAGVICLVQAGSAAADHTVVNCNHNPNALQPAITSAPSGATLLVKGVCFGNFTINKNLALTGLKRRGRHLQYRHRNAA